MTLKDYPHTHPPIIKRRVFLFLVWVPSQLRRAKERKKKREKE
jgi:hypothetical protein